MTNPRRARSMEALALVVVLWSAGRAGVIYWNHRLLAAPAPDRFTGTRPKPPNIAKTGAKVVPQPLLRPHPLVPLPSSPHRRAIMTLSRMGTAPEETVLPEPFARLPTAWDRKDDPRIATNEEAPSAALTPSAPASRQALHGGGWIVWRPDAAGQSLGTGGQLGGSQVGARLIVPLAFNDRLRASLRANAPLQRRKDYEIAPGISLRPFQGIPVELIVERRLRGAAQARDVTSIFVAGGATRQWPNGDWQTDIYAQAGMVGTQHPSLFAEGAATLRRSVGRGSAIGLGLWGGIQPRINRLDVGPSASTMVGPQALNLRLTLDWRVRISGDARPGSGVAISMSKDF